MASEVPTCELDALVTCGSSFFERIFTLEPCIKGVTHKVPIKVNNNFKDFPLIVCFKYGLTSILGHFDPKKAYLLLALQPANKIPYVDNEETANMYNIPKFKSFKAKPGAYGITK